MGGRVCFFKSDFPRRLFNADHFFTRRPQLHPVLRQNLVTIDIFDFLQPSATLYWYVGITIPAVLLFQSNTQRSMQLGS
jgi:hypothetical protein